MNPPTKGPTAPRPPPGIPGQPVGGHDDLAALRGRIQGRIDGAQDDLDDAKAEMRELPAEGRPPLDWRRIRAEELSARELEVLDLLAAGTSTAAIAKLLFIAPTTARNHVQKLLSKTGTHSRAELVAKTRELTDC